MPAPGYGPYRNPHAGLSALQARAALQRGPLVRRGTVWRFRRRQFSNATVAALVRAGAAIRHGSTIIAADQARPAE